MVKVHKIEFSTDGVSAEELKEKMSSFVDRAIAEDKKELKHIDDFIVALLNLVKVTVNEKSFNEYADAFAKHLIAQDARSKRAFYAYYRMSVEDAVSDIVGLISDFKSLSSDKEKGNEKPKNNNKKPRVKKEENPINKKL